MIAPAVSRIGETLNEIQIRSPSRRMRSASANSTVSPRRNRSRTSRSESCSSSGINLNTDWPTISAAGYPKIRSAAAFQLVTVPSSVLAMMASLEEETMAARRSIASCACLSRVTSRVRHRVCTSSPSARYGLESISTSLIWPVFPSEAGRRAANHLPGDELFEQPVRRDGIDVELADVVTDVFVALVAQHVQLGLIGPEDRAVRRHPVHGGRGVVEEVGQLRLAAPHGRFLSLRPGGLLPCESGLRPGHPGRVLRPPVRSKPGLTEPAGSEARGREQRRPDGAHRARRPNEPTGSKNR